MLMTSQLDSTRLAHQEAMMMYRKGVAPYLTVLSTQQALQQAELSNLQTQRDGVRIRLQTINALRVQAMNFIIIVFCTWMQREELMGTLCRVVIILEGAGAMVTLILV